MKHSTTVTLVLLVALLLAERIAPAFADAGRYDFAALVRAVETNAKATQDLAREVRDAAKACR